MNENVAQDFGTVPYLLLNFLCVSAYEFASSPTLGNENVLY